LEPDAVLHRRGQNAIKVRVADDRGKNDFSCERSTISTFDTSALRPTLADRALPIYVGVDASVKHDSSALVAVTWDREHQRVQLVAHKIFQPTPENPIDFTAEIEQTVLDWRGRFNLRVVYYDPYQMAASSQRLLREGIPMEEFAQSMSNLTAASQNLFEAIRDSNFVAYPNEAIRLAVSRAIAVESARGWRIGKALQSHKIDARDCTGAGRARRDACVR
jgi:phage terminase large subunit-like protein